MWEAVVVGAIGLAGVVVGQRMSQGAAQQSLYAQIEEQRRLEVRQLLVRFIVDVRAQIDQGWLLFPMFEKFQSSDYTEFVETDTGRAMAERGRRIEEDLTALALLVPDGPLRSAIGRVEIVVVREWGEKAVGPLYSKKLREDGRSPLEAAFTHLGDCSRALNDMQREASLHLVVPPGPASTWTARLLVRLRGGRRV